MMYIVCVYIYTHNVYILYMVYIYHIAFNYSSTSIKPWLLPYVGYCKRYYKEQKGAHIFSN